MIGLTMPQKIKFFDVVPPEETLAEIHIITINKKIQIKKKKLLMKCLQWARCFHGYVNTKKKKN